MLRVLHLILTIVNVYNIPIYSLNCIKISTFLRLKHTGPLKWRLQKKSLRTKI